MLKFILIVFGTLQQSPNTANVFDTLSDCERAAAKYHTNEPGPALYTCQSIEVGKDI